MNSLLNNNNIHHKPTADDTQSEMPPEVDNDSSSKLKSLQLLQDMFSGVDLNDDIKSNKKRSCRFNLGGHCATEDAMSMANQWHFLNSHLSLYSIIPGNWRKLEEWSHLSPGRRRRSAQNVLRRRLNQQTVDRSQMSLSPSDDNRP